eukprot:GILI01027158.1.p1 GENE.GILI01027158.1~~GILI01027158.1.p1  ORF type:complete len:419 (+),score=14.74 GILI01027158.1:90-1346(+)
MSQRHYHIIIRVLLILTTLSFSAYFFTFSLSNESREEVVVHSKSVSVVNRPPILANHTVLIWSPFFGDWTYPLLWDFHCRGFEVTRDRSKLLKASVVVFHGPDLASHSCPQQRKPGQIYVFFSQESPYSHPIPSSWTAHFNWTMTYMRTSDVYCPYGPHETFWPPAVVDISQKIAPAAVMYLASNCAASNSRDWLVTELQRYITVDSYGKCLHNMDGFVTPNGSYLALADNSHFSTIYKSYKFILAFENSICNDYLSEKFWRAFEYGVVPVVMGFPRVRDFAPVPDAIVDVNDFTSVEQLASYLQHASDPEEYMKFHKWRSMPLSSLSPAFKDVLQRKRCGSDFCGKLQQHFFSNDTGTVQTQYYSPPQAAWDSKTLCTRKTNIEQQFVSALSFLAFAITFLLFLCSALLSFFKSLYP